MRPFLLPAVDFADPGLAAGFLLLIAVIAGGGIAGLTKATAALIRAKSAAVTGGLGNPVVSTAETAGAATVSLVAVLAPLLADLSVPVHPLGDDAADAPMPPALRAAIARVRAQAPFDALRFDGVTVERERADLRFEAAGAVVHVWIELRDGRPSGGYRVDGDASEELVPSLRAVLTALAGRVNPRAPAPSIL